MPLIPVGRLAVATPETMAVAVNNPTVARDAVDARIQGVAADIIASDPGIIAGAEAAVDDAVTNARLVPMKVVASAGGQFVDMNSVDLAQSVMLDIRSSALNRPTTNGWHFVGWHIPNPALGIATQFASSPTSNRAWMRTRSGGSWGVWVELVAPQKSVHIEAGELVYDGPNAPAATHYLIPDSTGDLIARSSPFPTPSAAAPELTQ